MKFEYVGNLDLSHGRVDVTDPCYDRDVWCRFSTDVLPGMYKCYAAKNDIGRVSKIRIVHEDFDDKELAWSTEPYEDIGVDAGLAGFFNNKPDYGDDEWMHFCAELGEADGHHRGHFWSGKKNVYIADNCFFTQSGWGDGSYPVYVAETDGMWNYDGGEHTALEIDFLTED